MDSFHKFLWQISRKLSVIGNVCLVIMMGVVTLNVILRMAGHSILGVFEIVELAVVPMVAFALGYTAFKKNGHVAVDLLTSHLSLTVRRVLAIITTILSIGFWILVAWQSAIAAWQKQGVPEATITLQWPIWPMRWVMVFGVIILFLVLIADLIDLFKKRVEEKKEVQLREL